MNNELIFPIVYDLRVIYSGDGDIGIKKVSNLLNDLSINCSKSVVKPGGSSSLVRLGFNITIFSKVQMETMYRNLKALPDVKWAT